VHRPRLGGRRQCTHPALAVPLIPDLSGSLVPQLQGASPWARLLVLAGPIRATAEERPVRRYQLVLARRRAADRRGLLVPAGRAVRLGASRVAARRPALRRVGAGRRAFGRRPAGAVRRAFLGGWHAARAVPAVGAVEPGALEDDADRREDLAELATTGTAYSQRVVGKPLHDLGPVSALGAGVLVRRHDSSLCGVSTRRGQLLNGSNGYRSLLIPWPAIATVRTDWSPGPDGASLTSSPS